MAPRLEPLAQVEDVRGVCRLCRGCRKAKPRHIQNLGQGAEVWSFPRRTNLGVTLRTLKRELLSSGLVDAQAMEHPMSVVGLRVHPLDHKISVLEVSLNSRHRAALPLDMAQMPSPSSITGVCWRIARSRAREAAAWVGAAMEDHPAPGREAGGTALNSSVTAAGSHEAVCM